MSTAAARRVAWGVSGLVVLLGLVYAVLYYLARNVAAPGFSVPGSDMLQTVAVTIFGALVVIRFPRNPIGWMFLLGVGLVNAVLYDCQLYSLISYHVAPAPLLAAPVAAWLGGWLFIPSFDLMLTFVVLLFPDGRLPSRRWRIFARGLLAVVVLATVTSAIGAIPTRPRFHIDVSGSVADGDRLGLEQFELFPVLGAVVCLVALGQRFRRSRGDEREQLKWFLSAMALLVASFLISMVTGMMAGPGKGPPGWTGDLVGIASLCVPLSIAIALLKYRLYDIDLVISRTLVYGSLAAFITVVYVAIVVGVGALVGSGDRPNLVLSIVATAVVAVAFQPVRERLQRVANRLVYGKRATPYEVLSEFSSRVAESYAGEQVLSRMAQVLAEGTGADATAVWLRSGSVLRPAAAWPGPQNGHPAPVQLTGQLLPTLPGADRAVPVRHQGELLGALSVRKRPGESLTPIEEKLLDDLAHQAGLVLKNVGLTADLQARLEDLRASRQRLVAAQDQERRRLERNLHDGAQQHLVALKVKLGLAEMLAGKDPVKARQTIQQLKADADQALETLRDLARGIYPPLLAEKGLVAALESQARKATVAVGVEAVGVERYPQEVEAAVYFCCLEALQNVQKYARASQVTVRLRGSTGELQFEVRDDGAGFDPATSRRGSGLQNIDDRLSALGGSVLVESRPGGGTLVAGSIPVKRAAPIDRRVAATT